LVGQGLLKLETGRSRRFDQVTEQELRDTFADDKSFGEFVIPSQEREVHMQAAGEDDGPYVLEYRDGGADHHFSEETRIG
jgi:hypothetical protein